MTDEHSKKFLEITTSNLDRLGSLVKLSEELTTYLSRIDAQISVRFDPATSTPLVEVVGLDGHRICPASEFKRISGYRKFLGTVLKEKEIETSSEAKIEIVASLVRLYAKPIPEKILQENHQKLIQVKLDLEVLAENMEKLQDLLTNDFQTYLLDIGERIDIILSGLMTKLVGNDKVSNEERDEALLKAKIPKWIFTRFLQKDWIKNETEDAKSLLFPKGNFLKGVALSLVEINEADFVEQNTKITEASTLLFALLKKTEIINFLTVAGTDAAANEALKKEREKFQWTLVDPNPDDIFLPRKQGKNPPTMMVEKPRANAKGNASQLAKLRLDQRNRMKAFSDHFQMIVHGAIILNKPVEQFWSKIMTKTDTWAVTPDKTIFNWIEDEKTNLEVFNSLSNPKKANVLTAVLELLFMKIGLIMKTDDLDKFVIAIGTLPVPKLAAKARAAKAGTKYVDILDTSLVRASDKEKAKDFLGMKPKKEKAPNTRGQGKALEKDVKKIIVNSDIPRDVKKEVLDWISRNFTSKSPEVRELAAELIVGAFERQDISIERDEDGSDSETSS
jgi:hypothetical protein